MCWFSDYSDYSEQTVQYSSLFLHKWKRRKVKSDLWYWIWESFLFIFFFVYWSWWFEAHRQNFTQEKLYLIMINSAITVNSTIKDFVYGIFLVRLECKFDFKSHILHANTILCQQKKYSIQQINWTWFGSARCKFTRFNLKPLHHGAEVFGGYLFIKSYWHSSQLNDKRRIPDEITFFFP